MIRERRERSEKTESKKKFLRNKNDPDKNTIERRFETDVSEKKEKRKMREKI